MNIERFASHHEARDALVLSVAGVTAIMLIESLILLVWYWALAQTAKPSALRAANGFAFVPHTCRVLGQQSSGCRNRAVIPFSAAVEDAPVRPMKNSARAFSLKCKLLRQRCTKRVGLSALGFPKLKS